MNARPALWFVLGATLLVSQASRAQDPLFRQRGTPPDAFGTRFGGNPAAAALVIYNENDPLSRDLAGFYAEKRGIELDRVVGLKCSLAEEISREEYDATLAAPLRALFDARGWWTRTPDRADADPSSVVSTNRIRFLVLMRGIPLKISHTVSYAGDACSQPSPIGARNDASVDSELAVLGGFTRHISGFLPNPYFHSYESFLDFGHPGMMLATRLDGPSGTTVRRMIDDSLAVEKTGLWGRCYVDGRGLPATDPLADGDTWMQRIATRITPFVLPTIYDNAPAVIPADYPMTGAALYFGWYAQEVSGAIATADFRFQPGAVACHLHSYSATSVRDSTRWWVGPMLEKGAAAVLGNVYEPYFGLTTHFDLLAERLCSGLTFAESCYAATPGLSWMNTFVGDPLYRPCAAWQNLDMDPPAGASGWAAEGRAYYTGAQTWRAQGPGPGAKALEQSAVLLHSGLILEGMGLLQASVDNVAAARSAFERAGRLYTAPADKVRAVLDEAQTLAGAGQKTAALQVLAAARRKLGTTGPAASFAELEAQLGAATP